VWQCLQVLIAEVNIKISGREIQTCLQERLDVNTSISCDQQRVTTNGMDPDKYATLSDDTHREQRKTTRFLQWHISAQKSHIYGREHCETHEILAKHFWWLGKLSVTKRKHPLSVHVWNGISKNGTTDITIFIGVTYSSGYQTILKDYLLPFIGRAYPKCHRLVTDNDPRDISRSNTEWMKANNINLWPTQLESRGWKRMKRITGPQHWNHVICKALYTADTATQYYNEQSTEQTITLHVGWQALEWVVS